MSIRSALALPMILSYMLDDVVPTGDKRALWLWGGVMLICTVSALLFNIIANRMAHNTNTDYKSSIGELIVKVLDRI